MDIDLKKLSKLIKIMKKEGVLTLKAEGIELNLDPHFVPHTSKAQSNVTTATVSLDEPVKLTPEEISEAALLGLTPEDYSILTYSTPLHRQGA